MEKCVEPNFGFGRGIFFFFMLLQTKFFTRVIFHSIRCGVDVFDTHQNKCNLYDSVVHHQNWYGAHSDWISIYCTNIEQKKMAIFKHSMHTRHIQWYISQTNLFWHCLQQTTKHNHPIGKLTNEWVARMHEMQINANSMRFYYQITINEFSRVLITF